MTLPKRISPERMTYLSPRDIDLFCFIRKWKVATSAVLLVKFFQSISPFTGYRRLWALEKGGYLQTLKDAGARRCVWTLAKKSFANVKDELYPLKEDGWKSEHLAHDILCNAFHLGPWVISAPSWMRIISEQQLRRWPANALHEYVPRECEHRPDGYTIIEGSKTYIGVAYEVELTGKKIMNMTQS